MQVGVYLLLLFRRCNTGHGDGKVVGSQQVAAGQGSLGPNVACRVALPRGFLCSHPTQLLKVVSYLAWLSF